MGFTEKLDSAGLELSVGLVDVVGVKHDVGKSADPVLLSLGREQNHPGFRLGRSQLDPTLFTVERLVREDREPQFLGVKIKRAILIAHRRIN